MPVKEVIDQMSLPNGIRSQINAAQTGTSQRALAEQSVTSLEVKKLTHVDAVVRAYLDTNWIDSARVFLETEGSPEALCALVPIEVRRDTLKTKGHLASLRAIAATLDTIKYGKQKVELNSFCDFYQDMIRISNRAGGLMNLNSDELNNLERYARGTTAIASNARAVLNHIKQNTHSYNLENPNFFYGNGKNGAFTEGNTSNEVVKEQDYFKVYPNPANNLITIELVEYGKDCFNCSIVITDLLGKIISENSLEQTTPIGLNDLPNGIYFISIKENDRILETERLIIEH
jgi:hypothetical protein